MKILFIGAHPDDNEFRCGGLAAKYRKAGHEVTFLSMLDGSGGHQTLNRTETAARRYGESRMVEQLLDIRYDVWNIPDCELMADLPTRMRLTHYIRRLNPDVIFCNRPNDYHADHRNASLLVQDASYLLMVPNFCPETPAMAKMPAIFFNWDRFKNPLFEPDVLVSIDDVIDTKLKIADAHVSQVYEWLPFVETGDISEIPADPEGRFAWLKGSDITFGTSDEEVLATKRGYLKRFAMPAALYRQRLTERYGEEVGSKVRFAEAYQLCEYGEQPDAQRMAEIFPF